MHKALAVTFSVILLALGTGAQEGSGEADTVTVEPSSSLEGVIARYEEIMLSASPAAQARAEQRAPTRWPDVSPEYISKLATDARLLKGKLAGVPDKSSPEWVILSHLLEQLIMQDAFDTERIPFTGDYGFHAVPFFTAAVSA